MKKIILTCFLFLTSYLLVAQGVWTQKADFGGGARREAIGFSMGSKGYIGGGIDSSGGTPMDFWEYDPSLNFWIQKANLPGFASIGFSIQQKGYILSGNNFLEYSPTIDLWTIKASFPGDTRDKPVAFSIGSKGYIGTGYSNVTGGLLKDFWEYNPASDTWTQKTDFGGTARNKAIGFSIGGKGYIGTGWDSFGTPNDFWEYDTLTDTWTQKTDIVTLLNTGRYSAIAFSMNNKGYMGTGYLPLCGSLDDFYEYDPISDSWTQKTYYKGPNGSCSGYGTWNAVGFSIGNKGYIGTGEYTWFPSSYGVQKDFWEYDPNGVINVNEEENKSDIIISPNPFSTFTKISFQNQKSKGINCEIKIYDLSGKKISPTILENTNSIIIHRNNLEAGVYYLIIRDKEKMLMMEKILVID